jgi:hypothetical protein
MKPRSIIHRLCLAKHVISECFYTPPSAVFPQFRPDLQLDCFQNTCKPLLKLHRVFQKPLCKPTKPARQEASSQIFASWNQKSLIWIHQSTRLFSIAELSNVDVSLPFSTFAFMLYLTSRAKFYF